jgi:predicted heme/steroid binding protein
MRASVASLMSVPVNKLPQSVVGVATVASADYGLILNRCELARYNGRTEELPVLIAYKGRIYDVTGRTPWNGDKNWQRYAGRDCTANMRAHPRRDALLDSLPCVGMLED